MTEKLSQKNINLIFAVTENVVSLYQVNRTLGFSLVPGDNHEKILVKLILQAVSIPPCSLLPPISHL